MLRTTTLKRWRGRIADKVKKPPIQDAVERATSEMLLQPDWENNLVICDAMEQKHDLCVRPATLSPTLL